MKPTPGGSWSCSGGGGQGTGVERGSGEQLDCISGLGGDCEVG